MTLKFMHLLDPLGFTEPLWELIMRFMAVEWIYMADILPVLHLNALSNFYRAENATSHQGDLVDQRVLPRPQQFPHVNAFRPLELQAAGETTVVAHPRNADEHLPRTIFNSLYIPFPFYLLFLWWPLPRNTFSVLNLPRMRTWMSRSQMLIDDFSRRTVVPSIHL